MAPLKNRVKRLEAMLRGPEELTGVLYYHDELIIMDGHVFESIVDVPSHLREKYPDLLVGRVEDQYGNVVDVTAPGGSGENEHGFLLVPKTLTEEEWAAQAEKLKMKKEI